MNSLENIIYISEKILGSIKRPIPIGEDVLELSATIGISVYPDDGQDVDDLIRKADHAMYDIKELNSSIHFYSDEDSKWINQEE